MGLSDLDTGVHGQGGPVGVTAVGTTIGVRGQSDDGRGGVFQGRKAQLRLLPATANNHPASGSGGDLFLDKRRRLWLCKGGTTWVKLA